MSESRDGCCATWPKPCSYHEGYQDALDTFERVELVPSGTPVWVRRG